MPIDNSFLVRKIRTRESMVVAYSAVTNMSFVVCDPETFNDQVWIFENETLLQDFAKTYSSRKIPLRGVKYLTKDFLSFFSSLFLIDVNELVFVNEAATMKLDLDKLVQKPDYSKIPAANVPVSNPSLQLTGLYFVQEASRAVPADQKDLSDLQEELSVNLVRARFLVAIDPSAGNETIEEKLRQGKFQAVLIKAKNGDVFQPLFTDMVEFQKFSRKKRLVTVAMPYAALPRLLSIEAKGFVLNPAGFHIMLPRELINGLQNVAQPDTGNVAPVMKK